MTYLSEFRKRIEKNDYHDFLKLWEEYCYSDKPDGKELIDILKAAKNSPLAPSFGNHVEKAIALWKLVEDPKEKDQILKLILDIQTTNSEELAEIALDYLHEHYPNDPYFNEKIRLNGLRSKDDFQGAISKYELLTHLNVGKFVFHTGGWGTGEILDLSLIREEMTLEFEYVAGQKHFTFKKALNTLIPLPDDHFLARRFGNPDLLEKEAMEDPLKIILLLLKDLGPKTALEIKEELCDLVIPEKDWTKWWQNAKNKIKKCTQIYSPADSSESYSLRQEALSHEENLYLSLSKKPDINMTLQIVYTFLRDFPELLKKQEFKTNLHTKLVELLSNAELTAAQKIQLLFLLSDLVSDQKYTADIANIIKHTVNLNELLNEIEIISFKKKILQLVKSLKDNWEEFFLEEIFNIKENVLRDFILSELEKSASKTRLDEKIQKLLNHPAMYPKIFIWYFQKILKEPNEHPLSTEKNKNKFFEGFMILLDHLYLKTEYKDLTKKMISMLTSDRFQFVRTYFESASLEDVKEFLLLSTKCSVLTDHDIKIIHSLGEVVFPSLKSLRKAETVSEELEVIWTTKEGYAKTQKRITEIGTVETVQNAHEIEEARAHGDLRENAEYKSALEHRSRLQAELKILSEQLNKARILTSDDVQINKAGIGTVVECEKQDGEKITFTILGPWDANPDKNILSFQSKLARSMSNLGVGEEFSFNGVYKIIKISNYFDKK